MKITNIEKFENFIKTNAKEYYDIESYIDDLIETYQNSGSKFYEMKSTETKSKHTEIINFEVKYTFYIDNKEFSEEEFNKLDNDEYDYCEMEIIF